MALHTERLNIVSLCTGGFGLDHAVELAIRGARTVCMVEREAFAVAQLVCSMEAGSLAPAPIWSDARTFNGRPWRGLVDGLIGGIPCQPHSLAGKQLGEEDDRDLWSTARRIIVQSGAWFAVIENVRGMLSSGGAERVWRDFHRLGFTVEGGLFTASEVGAPHERERLFILAVADRCSDGQQRSEEPDIRPIEPRQQASRRGDTERRDYHMAGVGQADAFGKGLEGIEPGGASRQREQGATVERDGRSLGNADTRSPKEREGNAAFCQRGAKQPTGIGATSRDADVVNAFGRGRARRSEVAIGRTELGTADERSSGRTLFPPRPDDIDGWRDALSGAPQLEPAFRRVADGLASRLDIGRVDRLRMLGNGVVPLEGAYAIRTLATRLAARGSTAAARLVRMMEDER